MQCGQNGEAEPQQIMRGSAQASNGFACNFGHERRPALPQGKKWKN